jgi:predicted histone-like DNA-binding protein
MALKYVIVERRITVGSTPGLKFLAKIVQDDTLDVWNIADKIAETSALSKGDIVSVLLQHETVLECAFFESNPIQLGRMSRLVPGFTAKAMNTKEEVDASTIKRIYVRFAPSRKFSRKLKEAKVVPQQLDIKGLQIPTSGEVVIP